MVNSDANKKYVVVSAPGKDEQHAFKITELLIKLYHARPNSINFKNLHAEIMQRFYNIIDELNLDKSLKLLVTNTFSNVKKLSYAKLVSRGEYLNAQIMANYLGWHFVDTNDFLIIENGQINYVASQLRLANIMHNDDKIVFPGFYGVNFNGEIQLLPRGGGDTSGAAISNLLGVDKYENWTDIDGIQVVDPHIIKNSVKIDSLSYDELQELSYMGLSVFQEDSINPLKNKNIPLVIRNTNHPHRLGTTISNQNSSSDITGVIGDQEYSLISIKKYGLAKETNNMIAILNVLNQFNLEIKCMVSEFDSINLFVKNIEK
ncbi:amino acid kinase family protein [Apilactobacillus ozensis]|uniref:amino acid kinase family protein n=1 Tax=Apilactobacillus ozensis TaxID=866801 RepID=UPI003F6FF011